MNRKTLLIFLCLFAFTINVSADFVTQIDTNFDDATLQGWDINSGTWSAANLDMNGAFLDGGSISNDVNMPIGGQYQIHFTAITSNTSLLGKIVFYTDQNGFTDANGYEFVLRDVNTLFRKITNGVSSNLIVGPPVTLNTIHTVDINISGTNYTIYVDGSLFGSTNDSTFTAGTKIFFGTENGSGAWAFDNIVVRANIVGSFGTITVLRPIDERTLEQIDGNWSSQLTNGPGSALLIADDASKNFVGIQSTTIANNIIVDDANGNGINDLYFPSTYSVILDQNEDTLILQPYLVSRSDGSEVTFIIYNKFDNTTLSNLLVRTSRPISGVDTETRSNITNGTGIVTFSFLNTINYDVNVSDINMQNSYFPDEGQSGSFTNIFSLYNIFVSTNFTDINVFDPNWSISTQPSSDTLTPSTTQYFDVNVNTNYAQTILFEYYDSNTLILSSSSNSTDKNIGFLLDTTATTKFITLKITITNQYRRDVYIQTYHIVDTIPSLGVSFNLFSNNTGIFGGMIILLCTIFLAIQQFGPNLFGNNESQIFLVGLIMIGGGLLFFPTNLLPILIALTFGIVVYLQVRT